MKARILFSCLVGGLVLSTGGRVWAQQNQAQSVPNTTSAASRAANQSPTGTFYDPYGIGRTPWYSGADIRNELNLNDNQFNQLNRGYMQSWRRYNEGVNGLNTNLSDVDRLRAQQVLADQFYKENTTGFNNVITDPAVRRRYQQLHWQYRGYGTFTDPNVQRELNLTDDQLQQFAEYNRDWNTQRNEWNRRFANQREATTKQFLESRTQIQDRLSATLTPSQRALWGNMTGRSYEFQPGAYFDSTTPTGAASTGVEGTSVVTPSSETGTTRSTNGSAVPNSGASGTGGTPK